MNIHRQLLSLKCTEKVKEKEQIRVKSIFEKLAEKSHYFKVVKI